MEIAGMNNSQLELYTSVNQIDLNHSFDRPTLSLTTQNSSRCSTCTKPRRPEDRTHRDQSPPTKLSNTTQNNVSKLVRATIHAIVPEICVANPQRSFNAQRQGQPIKQSSSYGTVECNSHLYHTSKPLPILTSNLQGGISSFTQTEDQDRSDGDSQTSETRLITAGQLTTFHKSDEEEEVYCFEEFPVQLPKCEKGNASSAIPNEQNRRFQEDGYGQDIKSYYFQQQQKPMPHEYRPPSRSPPSSPSAHRRSLRTNEAYTQVQMFSSSPPKSCSPLTGSTQHQEFMFNTSRHCSRKKKEPELPQTFQPYMRQPFHVQPCIMYDCSVWKSAQNNQPVEEESQTIPCTLPVVSPICCPPTPIAPPPTYTAPNCCPPTPVAPPGPIFLPCFSPPPFVTPTPNPIPPPPPEQPPPPKQPTPCIPPARCGAYPPCATAITPQIASPPPERRTTIFEESCPLNCPPSCITPVPPICPPICKGMMVEPEEPPPPPPPPTPPPPPVETGPKMKCKCKSTTNITDCSCTPPEQPEYFCQREKIEETKGPIKECEVCGGTQQQQQQQQPSNNKKGKKEKPKKEKKEKKEKNNKKGKEEEPPAAKCTCQQPCVCPPINAPKEPPHCPHCYQPQPLIPPMNMIQCPAYEGLRAPQAQNQGKSGCNVVVP